MLKPIEMAELTEKTPTEKKREVKGPYYQTFDIVCILVLITIVVLWYFLILKFFKLKNHTTIIESYLGRVHQLQVYLTCER